MKKENTGFKKLKKSGKVWIAIATFAVIGMGTVSVNADDSMSSTDIIVVADPTTPPVTTDPTTPPVTTDPTTPPVTADPTTPPVTTDPTTPPVTTDPTTPPVTTDPGTTDPGTTDPGTTDPGTTDPGTTDPGTTDPGTTDPGTTDPGTTDPGTTDPTTPPVTEEPTTSKPGKDSKPDKPNKGNSTPIFNPTPEKPLITEGKNEIIGVEGSSVLVKQNDQTVKMSANEVGGTVLDNGDIQVKNDKGEVKTLKVLPKTSDSKTLLPVVGIILMILTFLLTSKKKEENL